MPFISEELFQRLPRADDTPSICIAEYPDVAHCPWRNEQIEREVEFVQKTARIIRSARSDYNIPNKTKTEAFIVCTADESLAILQKFAADLATTAFCSRIVLETTESPPAGCAILTISGQCVVHLLLRGLIETDKELTKLQSKKDVLEQTVGKLNKAMAANDYELKVPVEVRETNAEKLAQNESEILRIATAMETLKLM